MKIDIRGILMISLLLLCVTCTNDNKEKFECTSETQKTILKSSCLACHGLHNDQVARKLSGMYEELGRKSIVNSLSNDSVHVNASLLNSNEVDCLMDYLSKSPWVVE